MKTIAIQEKKFSGIGGSLEGKSRMFEQCAWLLLLLFCNHSLLQGQVAGQYVFYPSLAQGGEWYRWVLSPFVHVGWYHLFLDSAAFLFLWRGLDEDNSGNRWIYFIFCWAGSMFVPLLVSEQVYQIGLCGLSGISHGLLAVAALELMAFKSSKQARIIGLSFFGGLFAKIVWEITTGEAFLANLHLGPLGTPVVSSHLGGFIGGVFGFAMIHMTIIWNKGKQFCGKWRP